ncbi:MAG: FG-GAP-like repeat-containing protein [Candidatus Helarchaeota archaeon]
MTEPIYKKNSIFFISNATRRKIMSFSILSIFTFSIFIGLLYSTGLIYPFLSSFLNLGGKSQANTRLYYQENLEIRIDSSGNLRAAVSFLSEKPFISDAVNVSSIAYNRIIGMSLDIFNDNETLAKYMSQDPWDNVSSGEILLSVAFASELELLESELQSYGDALKNDINIAFNLNSTPSELQLTKIGTSSSSFTNNNYDTVVYSSNFSTGIDYGYFISIANNSLPDGIKNLIFTDDVYSRNTTLHFEWTNVFMLAVMNDKILQDYYRNKILLYERVDEYYSSPYSFNTSRTFDTVSFASASQINNVNSSFAESTSSSITIQIENSQFLGSYPDITPETNTYLYYNMSQYGSLENITVDFVSPIVVINRTLPVGNNFGDLESIQLDITNATGVHSVQAEIYESNLFHNYVDRVVRIPSPNQTVPLSYNNVTGKWEGDLPCYVLDSGSYTITYKAIFGNEKQTYSYLFSKPRILEAGELIEDINIMNTISIDFDIIDPLNNSILTFKNDQTVQFAINVSSNFSISRVWGEVYDHFNLKEGLQRFQPVKIFHEDPSGRILMSATMLDANADGFTDILGVFNDSEAMSNEIILFLGNGSNIFDNETSIVSNGSITSKISTGDFDGDTVEDFAVGWSNGSGLDIVQIWLNNFTSPGNFYYSSNISLFDSISSLTCGDFNNSGYDDLIVSTSSQDVKLFLNNGTGFNQDPENFNSPYADGSDVFLASGDFNNDTHLDVVMLHGSTADLWTGNSTGMFEMWGQVSPSNIGELTAIGGGDLNGDGVDEILFGDRGGYITVMSYNNSVFEQIDHVTSIDDNSQSTFSDMGIDCVDASGDVNKDNINDMIVTSSIESKLFKNLDKLEQEEILEFEYDIISGLWNATLPLYGLTYGNLSVKFFAEDIHNAVGSSKNTFNIYLNNTYYEDFLDIVVADGEINFWGGIIGTEFSLDVNTSIPELDGVQQITFVAYVDNETSDFSFMEDAQNYFVLDDNHSKVDIFVMVQYTGFFSSSLMGPDRTAEEMASRASAIESEIEKVFGTGTELELISVQDQNGTGVMANNDMLLFGMNYTTTFNKSHVFNKLFTEWGKGSNLFGMLNNTDFENSDSIIEVYWNRPGYQSAVPNQQYLGENAFPMYDTGNSYTFFISKWYKDAWNFNGTASHNFTLSKTLGKAASNLVQKPNSTADMVRSGVRWRMIDDPASLFSSYGLDLIGNITYVYPYDGNVSVTTFGQHVDFNILSETGGLEFANDIQVFADIPQVTIDIITDPILSGNATIRANITSPNDINNESVVCQATSVSNISLSMGRVYTQFTSIPLEYNSTSGLYEGYLDTIEFCPSTEIELSVSASDSLIFGNYNGQDISYSKTERKIVSVNNSFYGEAILTDVDQDGNVLVSGFFGGYNIASGVNITSAFDNVKVKFMASSADTSLYIHDMWDDDIDLQNYTYDLEYYDILLIIRGHGDYSQVEWDQKAVTIKDAYKTEFNIFSSFTLAKNFTLEHQQYYIYGCNYSVRTYSDFVNKFHADVPGGLSLAFTASRLTSNSSYVSWEYDSAQFEGSIPPAQNFYDCLGYKDGSTFYLLDPNVDYQLGYEIISAHVYYSEFFGSNYNSTPLNRLLNYSDLLDMPLNLTNYNTSSYGSYVETTFQNANITNTNDDAFTSTISTNGSLVYNTIQHWLASKDINILGQNDYISWAKSEINFIEINFTSPLFGLTVVEPISDVSGSFNITVNLTDNINIDTAKILNMTCYFIEKSLFETSTSSLEWITADIHYTQRLTYFGSQQYKEINTGSHRFENGTYVMIVVVSEVMHNDVPRAFPPILAYTLHELNISNPETIHAEFISPVGNDLTGVVDFSLNVTGPYPITQVDLYFEDFRRMNIFETFSLEYNATSTLWEGSWPSYGFSNQDFTLYVVISDNSSTSAIVKRSFSIYNTEFMTIHLVPFDPQHMISMYRYVLIGTNTLFSSYIINARASGPAPVVQGYYEVYEFDYYTQVIGNLVSTGNLSDPFSIWFGQWDSSTVENGMYLLKVMLVDAYNVTASAEIPLQVDNGGSGSGSGGGNLYITDVSVQFDFLYEGSIIDVSCSIVNPSDQSPIDPSGLSQYTYSVLDLDFNSIGISGNLDYDSNTTIYFKDSIDVASLDAGIYYVEFYAEDNEGYSVNNYESFEVVAPLPYVVWTTVPFQNDTTVTSGQFNTLNNSNSFWELDASTSDGQLVFEFHYNVTGYVSNASKLALLFFEGNDDGGYWNGNDGYFDHACLEIMNQSDLTWVTVKQDYGIRGDSFDELISSIKNLSQFIGGDGELYLRFNFSYNSGEIDLYMTDLDLLLGEIPFYEFDGYSGTIQDTIYNDDVSIKDSDMTFINVTFNGNVGVDLSTVNLADCVFNYPVHVAGSIYADNSSVSFENCNFTWNSTGNTFYRPIESVRTAPIYDGALFVAGSAQVTVSNSSFYDTITCYEFADVYLQNSTLLDGVVLGDNSTLNITSDSYLTAWYSNVIDIGVGFQTFRSDKDGEYIPQFEMQDSILDAGNIHIQEYASVKFTNTNSTAKAGYLTMDPFSDLTLVYSNLSSITLQRSIWDVSGNLDINGSAVTGSYADGLNLDGNSSLKEPYYINSVYFGYDLSSSSTLSIFGSASINFIKAGSEARVEIRGSFVSEINVYENATVVFIESTYSNPPEICRYEKQSGDVWNALIFSIESDSGDADHIQGNVNTTVLDAIVGNENLDQIELWIEGEQKYANSSPSLPFTWIWDSLTVQNGSRDVSVILRDDGVPIVSCTHDVSIYVDNNVNSTELTMENPVSGYLEVEEGQNATYCVYYNDTTSILPISGASVTTNWNWNHAITDLLNGSYKVDIFETDIAGPGEYPIQIQASKVGFETATVNVTLNITAKTDNNTELISTGPTSGYLETDIGTYGNFTIYYNNTDLGIGIANANINTNWTKNWNFVDAGSGYYNVNFEAAVNPGNHAILVNASKKGEANATLLLVLNVTGQMTMNISHYEIDGLYPRVPAILYENATFQVCIKNKITGDAVQNANISLLNYQGSWESDTNGNYNITIYGDAFTEYGVYFVNYTVSAPGYKNETEAYGIAMQINMTSGYTSSPPTLDGSGDFPSSFIAGSQEWKDAVLFNYSYFTEDVSNIEINYTFKILIMNDENNLYIGYEIDDNGGWDGSNWTEADGIAPCAEYINGSYSYHDLDIHAVYDFDIYDWFINSSISQDPLNDTDHAGTNDTLAATDWFSLTNHAEIQVPLSSGDLKDWDLIFGEPELFGFYVFIYEVCSVINPEMLHFDGYLTLGEKNKTELTCMVPPIAYNEIASGENATFIVYYNDTDNNLPILGAIVESNWSYDVWYDDYGNGSYSVNIFNTSNVTPGSYLIEIIASKAGYKNGTCYLVLNVSDFNNTELYCDYPSGAYLEVTAGNIATYTLYYNDTDKNEGINNATLDSNWTYGNFTLDLGGGYVNFSTWNTDIPGPGIYIIEINASKFGYKTATCYVTLNVTSPPDSISPNWSNPIVTPASPQIFVEGLNIIFNITWNDNVGVQTVYFELNGTNNTVTTFTGNEYSFNLTDISAGFYEYRWWASDFAENWNVTDLANYTIDKNASILVLLLNGTDGDVVANYSSIVNITAEVLFNQKPSEPVNVSIFINDTLMYLINTSESVFHVFNSVGVYNITVFFNGNENYTASSTTHFVQIVDEIPPDIPTPPADIEYNYGDAGPIYISWTFYDYNDTNAVYNITRNDTGLVNQTGSFLNGTPIQIDVSGLESGIYFYTIGINDTYGNSVNDTVKVTVKDQTDPVLDYTPLDISYQQGAGSGKHINWSAWDQSGSGWYNITKDGLLVQNGSWTNNVNVTIDVSGLSQGVYNYLITFYDAFWNDISDLVVVTVTAPGGPPTIDNPSDIQYEMGDTGNVITWDVSDSDLDVLYIYRNGTLIQTRIWGTNWSTSTVQINIDGLSVDVYNYTIHVIDQVSNEATDLVYVTVVDTTDPYIDVLYNGMQVSYNEGDTGNTLTWNVTDINPGHYNITRDGLEIMNGIWNNGTNITINIDGLNASETSYYYVIYVYDSFDNLRTDDVYVKVNDTTNPAFISWPSDKTIEFGSSGNSLSWNATDAHPNVYTITLNGSPIVINQTWSDYIFLDLDALGLNISLYLFQIVIYDIDFNYNMSQVYVNVTDTIEPTINNPADISYQVGSTGNTITWSPSDLAPSTYVVYNQSTIYTSGIWDGISNIIVDVDGLSAGSYNFTIYCNDTSGNFVTDEVNVTVTSTAPPQISHPSDFSAEQFSGTRTITWVPSDNDPDVYNITKNGSLVTGHIDQTWSDLEDINLTVSTNVVGVWLFVITLKDQQGNVIEDEVYVTIYTADNDPPTIISSPSISGYEFGTSGHYLRWNVSDVNPDTYELYRNGFKVSEGTWQNYEYISRNIDGLPIGTYNYTLWVYDDFSQFTTDDVIIDVHDSQPPQLINPPTDKFIELGTTGNEITWNATDSSPFKAEIRRDGILIDVINPWAGGIVTINIDGLSLGVYTYKITFYDTSLHVTNDTVQVTVQDSINPLIIDKSSNLQYEIGTTGHSIYWTATDCNPNIYDIKNGSGITIATGAWTSGTPIYLNLDSLGLGQGVHSFTCWVYDGSGNSNSSEILVTVEDNTAPDLNNPDDIAYLLGSTGHAISWIATDHLPNSYAVFKDGSLYGTYQGAWTSGTPIEVNVDGLAVGTYNFTIIVNDTKGNTVTDTVFVQVTSSNPPAVSHPEDFSYRVGDPSSYVLSWTPDDSDPDFYSVYKNGSLIDSGFWSKLVPINIDVSGLPEGVHNYTIELNDTAGNVITDMVLVTVYESTPPVIAGPDDLIYDLGSTGNELSWGISDSNPGTYKIFLEGSLIKSGSWTNSVNVTINVDGLSVGTYTYELIALDSHDNNDTDLVNVTVQDNSNPSIYTETPTLSYLVQTTGHSITWHADDDSKDYYNILRDGTVIESDFWTTTVLVVNIDGLSVGVYNFTAIVYDSESNSNASECIVTVYENTPPTINQPSSITYEENHGGSQIMTWTASDDNPYLYQIINVSDGSVLETNAWNSSTITYDVSNLAAGSHSFKCKVIDLFLNNASSVVLVTVTPMNGPELNHPVDMNYLQGQAGVYINWTPTDATPNPDTYIIYNESVVVNSGAWSSGVSIIIDVSGLTVNSYNFTIMVNDTDGNVATDTVWVVVTTGTPPDFLVRPADIQYVEGSTGNYINWVPNSTPASCENYTIYRDGTIVYQGVWSNNATISRNIDGLSYGTYHYVLRVYNIYGYAEDEVLVNVTDQIAPTISPLPDVSYNEGETGNVLTWTVSDANPNIYEVSVDYGSGYVLENAGSWTNNVSVNIDGFTYGIYYIRVVVYDQAGNNATDVVKLTVNDVVAPNFLSPLPESYISSYSEGTSTLWAVWNAEETNPATYQIMQNGTLLIDSPWSGTSILYNVGGLSVGVYTFTCVINDQAGNNATNSFTLEVFDNDGPSITTPEDIVYGEDSIFGENGVTIAWTCWDTNPDQYVIYRTSSSPVINKTGTWTSGTPIVLHTGNLPVGNHNFTIVANDTSGNLVMDQVWVNVTAVPAPIIIGPADITMFQGETGHSIVWTFSSALYPSQYNITRNTILIQSGTWGGNSISYSIPSLGVGTHEFILGVNNTHDGSDSDTVIVEVLPLTAIPPGFNGTIPESGFYQYDEGTTGHFIVWIPNVTIDKLSDDCLYTITLDDVVIATGNYNDSSRVLNISLNIDGLAAGTYSFICRINNTDGYSAERMITVRVVDIMPPTVSVDQSLIQYSYGSTPPVLIWHPSDLHPDHYEITKNGTWIAGESWSGGDVSYNISTLGYPLPVGVHVFTLKAYDIDNNLGEATITVRVVDSQAPIFGPVSFPTEIIEGTSAFIEVEVTDTNLDYVKIIYSYSLSNGTNIVVNQVLYLNPNPYPTFQAILITDVYDQNANISFMLTAADTHGNVRNSTPIGYPYYMINVLQTPDIVPPQIIPNLPEVVNHTVDINISATVIDDRGIDMVWLDVWIYNATSYTVTQYQWLMVDQGGNLYRYTIPEAFFEANFVIYYDILANDTSGNFNSRTCDPIYLFAGTPPVIHDPSDVKGGNSIEITVRVENADNVYLHYQKDGGSWTSMEIFGTGEYYTGTITSTTYGNYYIRAINADGTSISQTYYYFIGEYYSLNLTVPIDKIVGQNFVVSLSINNTSPFMYDAIVTLQVPSGLSLYEGRITEHSMILSGMVGIFDWKLVGITPGVYPIVVEINSTAFSTTTIADVIRIFEDNSPPQIGDVFYDQTPNVNAPVDISTIVLDNVKVDTVQIVWTTDRSLPFTSWSRSTMSIYGNYYVGSLPGQPEGTVVSFAIYANDTNGRSVVDNNYGAFYTYIATSDMDIQIDSPSIVNQTETFSLNITINNKNAEAMAVLITLETGSTNLSVISIPTGFIEINDVSFGQTTLGVSQKRTFGSWLLNGTSVGLYNITVSIYNQTDSQLLYQKIKMIQVIQQEIIRGTSSGDLEEIQTGLGLNVSFRFPSNESYEAWMNFFLQNPAGNGVNGGGSLVNDTGFYEFQANLPLIEGILCIPFNITEIIEQNIDPNTLTIAYFDEDTQTWVPVTVGWVVHLDGDPEEIWWACANISHFSFYAIIGEPRVESQPGPEPGPGTGGLPLEYILPIILVMVIIVMAALAIYGYNRRRQQQKLMMEYQEKYREEIIWEIDIEENVCASHEDEIVGPKYRCPGCGVDYCLSCAEKLLKKNESCLYCTTPMNYYSIKQMINKRDAKLREEARIKEEELAKEKGKKVEPDKKEPEINYYSQKLRDNYEKRMKERKKIKKVIKKKKQKRKVK